MDWLKEICDQLTRVADHYEKTAPTVCDWANNLYIRIHENSDKVALAELLFVNRFVEERQWMPPNYAANQVYHLMSRLGQDTAGHAGF
jgi:hypothetical protein